MTLLPKVLLAVGLVGAGTYVAVTKFHVSVPFANQLQPPENIQGSVEGISESVGKQTQQLSERTKEVSGHVQNVLGAVVQENTEESSSSSENKSSEPIHEKAFEYGRYLYCQQVVKDYESQNN